MSPQAEHHQTFLDLNPVGHHAAFLQPEKSFGVWISNIDVADLFGHIRHLDSWLEYAGAAGCYLAWHGPTDKQTNASFEMLRKLFFGKARALWNTFNK